MAHRNFPWMGKRSVAVFASVVAGAGVWCANARALEPDEKPADPAKSAAAPKPAAPRANLGAPILPAVNDDARKGPESASLLADPAIRRRLEEAERLAAEGRFSKAFELAQKTLDEPDDSFIPTKDGGWTSARRAAEQLVLKQGPKGLGDYRIQFGPQAAAILREGTASGDPRIWAEVLRRFFLTEAGLEAANLLASYQLDHGRPGLALVYLDRIFESPAHREQITDVLRAKRAVALVLLGRMADAEQTLSALSMPRIVLGGRERTGAEILETLAARGELSSPSRSDWPVFGGGPARNPRAPAGLPLLASDWAAPTVTSADGPMKAFLEEVLHLNQSAKRPTLLALYPVTARGRVFYRDFRRTSAIDLETGKVAWTNSDGSGPSLQANRPGAMMHPSAAGQLGVQATYISNSVYGTLSTDGARVYQIDALFLNPNPYIGRVINQRRTSDAEQRLRNRLTALDADTGEEVWRLGGAADGPAADTFFLGPPLPADGLLFVIGETRSELRLWCIQPENGQVRWSQVVAMSQRRIDNDPLRRSEACFLAQDQGILVCPTNLMRLVAVDPLTRTLLWTYSYADDNMLSAMFADQMPHAYLPATAFANDPPILDGGKVVFGASLAKHIHCLDLQTGERIWKVDRAGAHTVGAVVEGHVLLVGGDHVRSLRLETGIQEWRTPIGVASGRGIATAEEFLLPLADGRVAALELATGRIRGEVRSRGEGPVGNLVLDGRKVLAAGPAALEAFPLLVDVRREAEDRLAKDPRDPRGLVRRAQLELAQGDSSAAVRDLLAAIAVPAPAEVAETAKEFLFDVAGREALERPADAAEMLAALGRLAVKPEEKGTYLRLRAEHELARGDLAASLRTVEEHSDLNLVGLIPGERGMVRREPRVWTRSFLGRMLESAAEASMAPILEELDRRLTALVSRDEMGELERFASWLAGTPLGARASLALGERLWTKTRWGEAEIHLELAATARDPAVAGRAVQLLAEIALKASRPADALYHAQRLPALLGTGTLPDGRTAAAVIAEVQQRGNAVSAGAAPDWSFEQVTVQTLRNVRPDAGRPVLTPNFAEPGFSDDLLVTYNATGPETTLEMTDKRTGKRAWWVTLPRPNNYNLTGRFDEIGHMIVLSVGEMVHGVSALDRKLIWSRRINDQRLAGNQRSVAQSAPFFYPAGASANTAVCLVGPGFVAVRNGKELAVLDPWTGRDLWILADVEADHEIFGDHEVLFVASRDGKYSAYRTLDGRFLRSDELGPVVRTQRSLAQEPGKKKPLLGRSLLLTRTERGKMVVKAWDPWTGAVPWERGFAPAARFFTGDDGEMIAVEPGGKVTILEGRTGKVLLTDDFGGEAGGFQSRISTFRDAERRYVAVDQGRQGNQIFYMPQANMITRSVNGPLRAYDLHTGKPLWSRKVEGRSIVTSPTEALPVLFTIGTRLEDRGVNRRLVMTLELTDKRNGASLWSRDRSDNTPLTEVAYSSAEKWIELRSWGMRTRWSFLAKGEKAPKIESDEPDGNNPAAPFLDRLRRRNLAPKPPGNES